MIHKFIYRWVINYESKYFIHNINITRCISKYFIIICLSVIVDKIIKKIDNWKNNFHIQRVLSDPWKNFTDLWKYFLDFWKDVPNHWKNFPDNWKKFPLGKFFQINVIFFHMKKIYFVLWKNFPSSGKNFQTIGKNFLSEKFSRSK